MSGHSKWATIKHKKAAVDAKRSKAFSIVSKMITVAVREGGSGDPTQNPRLRLAIDKARAVNMPKVNIDKAIEKGLGKGGEANLEKVLYEGFGPSGVGLMVKIITDNRNRTAAEIKTLFDRNGGTLAGPGAVSYMFERSGEHYTVKVSVPIDDESRNQVLALKDKLSEHEDVEFVITNMVGDSIDE